MEKELMWIYGLLPEELIREITDICLEVNEGIGLSDRFFRFPLHVSLKRSFYTEEFEQVKQDVKKILKDYGEISCQTESLCIAGDMLWLEMADSERLNRIHELLDEQLRLRYSIPQDAFDINYHPHITLFGNAASEQLETVLNRLQDWDARYAFTIERYAIGSRSRENEFFAI